MRFHVNIDLGDRATMLFDEQWPMRGISRYSAGLTGSLQTSAIHQQHRRVSSMHSNPLLKTYLRSIQIQSLRSQD